MPPSPPRKLNSYFNLFVLLLLAHASLLILSSCSTAPKKIIPVGQPPKEKIYETIRTERGIASFYSGRWIGRKTASGEIYRATDITAAHKSLPFGTIARVTNLRNGKS
ncbi:MAG: septal ring lytic transglycosylase RlpA family protein, partial [Chthoniobacterales bacterium]|nr:septal ring lytic transglycosylase RlpA family protein [Chthoniobacterales bacterium]